jgi:hypothetical protein
MMADQFSRSSQQVCEETVAHYRLSARIKRLWEHLVLEEAQRGNRETALPLMKSLVEAKLLEIGGN